MPNGDEQIRLAKELRTIQATAAKEAAADMAQLRVYEQQREALYNRCRELKQEPQNLKKAISDLTAAIDRDLGLIKERYDSLQKGDQNGG